MIDEVKESRRTRLSVKIAETSYRDDGDDRAVGKARILVQWRRHRDRVSRKKVNMDVGHAHKAYGRFGVRHPALCPAFMRGRRA